MSLYYIKKSVVLLVLLISSSAFSQKERCTVYFKDGKTSEGLGKLKPDGNIKFRLNKDSESEIYQKNLIDKAAINQNGRVEIYKFKKVKEDFPIWMKVIVEGKVSLYTNDVTGYNFNTAGGNAMGGFGGMSYGGGGGTVIFYYVNHDGEDEVFKITSVGNISKNFKNAASYFFKDCPALVEKIQNKTYKKGDLEEMVKYYNSKCDTSETKTATAITN